MSAVVSLGTSATRGKLEMSALMDCKFLSPEVTTHAVSSQSITKVNSNCTSLHRAIVLEVIALRDWSTRARENTTISLELDTQDGLPMVTRQIPMHIPTSTTK